MVLAICKGRMFVVFVLCESGFSCPIISGARMEKVRRADASRKKSPESLRD